MLDAFISRTLHLVKTPCHVVHQMLTLVSDSVDSELAKTHPKFVAETDALLDSSMRELDGVAALINDASDVLRFEQVAQMRPR
jgi:hypothetical protein